MTDIEGMLNYYFEMGEEQEVPRWERLYDSMDGGNVFNYGALFGDETPAPVVPEFDSRLLTMEQLVNERYYVEHTEEELSQINKSIGVLTERIKGTGPRYHSMDIEYNNTISDWLKE